MGKTFAFLGAKDIGATCLRQLHSFCQRHEHQIIGVFTNPRGEEIRDYCKEHGLPTFEDPDQLMAMDGPDYLISVQYHLILKKHHLDTARIIAVNLHMAPLPEYRGCNQFSFAIVNGDQEFGTTLHQMDPGIDSGGILFERRFPIPENCFVDELYQVTFDHSVEMFETSLPLLVAGEYNIIPQETLLEERTTSLHFRKEIQQLKEIDLDWPQERILRHLRATAMPGFPPPYALFNDIKIELNVNREK